MQSTKHNALHDASNQADGCRAWMGPFSLRGRDSERQSSKSPVYRHRIAQGKGLNKRMNVTVFVVLALDCVLLWRVFDYLLKLCFRVDYRKLIEVVCCYLLRQKSGYCLIFLNFSVGNLG